MARRAVLTALLMCEAAIFAAIVHTTAQMLPSEALASVLSLIPQG